MYNTVSVRSQDIVVPGVMTLTVLAPEMAAASAPGQFYMLKSWQEQDPFLMRPISIDHIDVQAGTLTFLYKVVGRGTELLSHLRGGDTLELLGPLGKGFPIDGSCAGQRSSAGVSALRRCARWWSSSAPKARRSMPISAPRVRTICSTRSCSARWAPW